MSPISTELTSLEGLIWEVRRARERIPNIKPRPSLRIFALAIFVMIAEVLAVAFGFVPLLHNDRVMTLHMMLFAPAIIGIAIFVMTSARHMARYQYRYRGEQKTPPLAFNWINPASALLTPLICAFAWVTIRGDWASTEATNKKALAISLDPRCEILLSLDESLNRFSALEGNYLDDAARAKAGLLAAEEFAAKDREHWVRVRELQALGKELNDSFRARPLGSLKPLLLTTDSETRREQASDYTASLDELKGRIAAAREIDRSPT